MPTLELPERLNAVEALVDVHIAEGRGQKAAILCGDQTVTYQGIYESVNRFGNVLKGLGVRMEERVGILLPDTPEFAFAFFGSMKMGAVAIPMNTLLRPKDYEYLLNDSRARVLVVAPPLLEHVMEIRRDLKYLEHIIVTGAEHTAPLSLNALMQEASASLDPVRSRHGPSRMA